MNERFYFIFHSSKKRQSLLLKLFLTRSHGDNAMANVDRLAKHAVAWILSTDYPCNDCSCGEKISVDGFQKFE